jgi:putative acetyltransferase
LQLVILAAGRGVRLGKSAENKPKSLVTVDGVPYLELQLRAFDRFAFSRKIIVGGYGIAALRGLLDGNRRDDWTLVENADFLRGNLYSLKAALPFLSEDLFLFNADHYYALPTYRKIFAADSDLVAVFCDQDRALTDDDMKVKTSGPKNFSDGRSRVQAMSKTLPDFDGGYVGVTRVPKNLLPLYLDGVAATEREIGDKANVEHVIHWMAGRGGEIRVADTSGSWWTEIDTPEDLAKACATIVKNEGSPFSIRPVEPRDDAALARIIRKVMTEHGAVGEGFSIMDAEVDRMSGTYAAQGHRYRVVEKGGAVVGGGGVGVLPGAPSDVCELKKMYLLPEARGNGAGFELLRRCLSDARDLGYRTCYLETLAAMTAARKLYERVGFKTIPAPMGATGHHGCDAWYAMGL